IKIVQVGCGKAAAIERNQRTQLRRNYRNYVEDHPLWLIAALAEGLDHLQALCIFQALLKRSLVLHLLAEFGRKPIDLDPLEKFLDRLRAHHGLETGWPELLIEFAVLGFVLDDLAVFYRSVAGFDRDIRFKIENRLEIAKRDIEEVSDAAWQSLEEP